MEFSDVWGWCWRFIAQNKFQIHLIMALDLFRSIWVTCTSEKNKNCSLPMLSDTVSSSALRPLRCSDISKGDAGILTPDFWGLWNAGVNDPHRMAPPKQSFPWKTSELIPLLYSSTVSVETGGRHCCHLITSQPAVSLLQSPCYEKEMPSSFKKAWWQAE